MKASDIDRMLRAREQPPAPTPTAKNGASPRAPRSNGEHQEPPDSLGEEVIGRFLLGARFTDVAHLVHVEDYQPRHGLILSAIVALANEGKPYDLAMVQGQLERKGHLAAAGGVSYLLAVKNNTVGPENVEAYSRKVRECALMGRIGARNEAELQQRRQELRQQSQLFEQLQALEASPTRAIVLRQAADVIRENREPEWLNGLHRIVERNVIGVLAGSRSTFKSFIALHWAMLAALNGEVVVILSAEGSGLGRRIEAWLRHNAPTVKASDLRLFALERPVNLNSAEVLDDLCKAIDAANLTPGLTVVDTLSKYAPGLDENDNAEVAAFLTALSVGLRQRYKSTVLLVVHTPHADRKRPRGASALMANPDAEYIVERPDATGTACTVTRERFKDSPTLQPLAYTALVVDLERVDKYGDRVESLVLKDTDPEAVAPTRPSEPIGKAQRQLLAALRAHAKDGAGIWTIQELREIGRKAGLSKGSARSAAEALTFTPHMTATVGGWRLSCPKG